MCKLDNLFYDMTTKHTKYCVKFSVLQKSSQSDNIRSKEAQLKGQFIQMRISRGSIMSLLAVSTI